MDISLLFPLLIALLFIPIFLSGRRQRKQMMDMQQLQSSLQPGDEVTTTSGLRATVVDTSDEEIIELEISPGVTTIWLRAAIRERVNPATEGDGGGLDIQDIEAKPAGDDTVTEEDAVVNQAAKQDDRGSNGRG